MRFRFYREASYLNKVTGFYYSFLVLEYPKIFVLPVRMDKNRKCPTTWQDTLKGLMYNLAFLLHYSLLCFRRVACSMIKLCSQAILSSHLLFSICNFSVAPIFFNASIMVAMLNWEIQVLIAFT